MKIRETDKAYIPINKYIRYLRFMFHRNVLYFISHHKGHKWLNKVCKLMFFETDSYMLIIYHVA